MKTITITKDIFKFDELSDDAKETAREWWRSCENADSFFSETVFEDASTIAELFGLDIRTRPVELMNGTVRHDPAIYYSGFSSQGDGACFEGDYRYKKGGLKAVKDYAPKDTDLHEIVKNLQDVQKANFYQLAASTKHSGHYYHSGCMTVNVERIDDKEMTVDAEDDITQLLREFADWIYKRLETEYDYIMSDENVDENIIINEYDYDVDGNIA